MFTGRDVQRELAITHEERTKLTESGVLTTAGTFGRATIYNSEPVEELLRLTELKPEHPSVAVRMGPPQSAEDENPENPANQRQWKGWSEKWDDLTKAQAARMYWPVANPSQLVGGQLIAVVSHIVVGRWRITGFESVDSRVVFEVDQFDDTKALLRIGQGPLIKQY